MKMREKLIAQIMFLVVLLFNVQPAHSDEIGATVVLAVSPMFSIQKQASSIEAASANPETGMHTGMQTVYDIVTNGTDSDYDITITSRIQTDAGYFSAYGNNGTLLFGNQTYLPTEADVNKARIRTAGNKNVIAYPVTTTITSPMTSTYYGSYGTYGPCYVIKLNNATSSTLSFMIGGTPVANTYSNTLDEAGSYSSTITFTVTPKL